MLLVVVADSVKVTSNSTNVSFLTKYNTEQLSLQAHSAGVLYYTPGQYMYISNSTHSATAYFQLDFLPPSLDIDWDGEGVLAIGEQLQHFCSPHSMVSVDRHSVKLGEDIFEKLCAVIGFSVVAAPILNASTNTLIVSHGKGVRGSYHLIGVPMLHPGSITFSQSSSSIALGGAIHIIQSDGLRLEYIDDGKTTLICQLEESAVISISRGAPVEILPYNYRSLYNITRVGYDNSMLTIYDVKGVWAYALDTAKIVRDKLKLKAVDSVGRGLFDVNVSSKGQRVTFDTDRLMIGGSERSVYELLQSPVYNVAIVDEKNLYIDMLNVSSLRIVQFEKEEISLTFSDRLCFVLPTSDQLVFVDKDNLIFTGMFIL